MTVSLQINVNVLIQMLPQFYLKYFLSSQKICDVNYNGAYKFFCYKNS